MAEREMKRKAHKDDRADVSRLSKAEREELSRALEQSRGKRISQATIGGKRVWIKRYDAVGRGFAKWAHAAAPIPVLHPFLRSSPWLNPAGMAAREVRKSAAFDKAGFAVPGHLLVDGSTIVSADCSPLAAHELARLAKSGAEAHDALLIQCASALGEVHAAGLCHGRPHPRDMFLTENGEIGFLDFEEEPEAAMPLATAQARDAWLLMQQIAGATLTPGADRAAFDAWRREAPHDAMAELRKAADLFSPVTSLLSAIGKTGWLGADGRRVRDAGLLLRGLVHTKPADAPKSAPNGKPV